MIESEDLLPSLLLYTCLHGMNYLSCLSSDSCLVCTRIWWLQLTNQILPIYDYACLSTAFRIWSCSVNVSYIPSTCSYVDVGATSEKLCLSMEYLYAECVPFLFFCLFVLRQLMNDIFMWLVMYVYINLYTCSANGIYIYIYIYMFFSSSSSPSCSLKI